GWIHDAFRLYTETASESILRFNLKGLIFAVRSQMSFAVHERHIYRRGWIHDAFRLYTETASESILRFNLKGLIFAVFCNYWVFTVLSKYGSAIFGAKNRQFV
ncbi:MAG: hypothetical protein WC166_02215, partial [Bacteroidales bacterium]